MATPALHIDRCTACGEPTHASDSDDLGRCIPCMRAAGDEPELPSEPQCPSCGATDEADCHCGELDGASPYDIYGLRGLVEAY